MVVLALGCFRSHEAGDPAVDGAIVASDAGTDAGFDAFVRRPDACMPEPAPEGGFEAADACRIPFADGCDGERVFDPICPICPHADGTLVDGTACDVPGMACEYTGHGFCNFWGCDCGDSDGDGALEWACWWPLC